VKELHPTLKFMMWDFGALTAAEERNYVHLKVEMIPSASFKGNRFQLTELIVHSQQLMREYAEEFITKHSIKITARDARDCAKSCVSQRDIQRVFVFFFWITKVYKKHQHNLENLEHHAILLSIGLVYYLRLKSDFRTRYANEIDNIVTFREMRFLQIFYKGVDWFISLLQFPDGIAKTKALKQNLFATIACTCTKTPLILVGKPGTSKTLSFNIAVDNLKGIDSDTDTLRDTEVFPSLDPQVYQCSRQTTSLEIDKLFRRAIKRQATYSNDINCVVFMDEAGLPEEGHESLKILHHFLDEHKVSFVAISNHILDAAKTNRAISVMIPETTEDDLQELVKGCYPSARRTSEVIKYCSAFLQVIENDSWKNIFGMRDFIHFLRYIYHKGQQLTKDLVLHALERNFNGTENFEQICGVFSASNVSIWYWGLSLLLGSLHS
jgi:hemicentin